MHNRQLDNVELLYAKPDGGEQNFWVIDFDSTFPVSTYVGDRWRLRSRRGLLLLEFVVAPGCPSVTLAPCVPDDMPPPTAPQLPDGAAWDGAARGAACGATELLGDVATPGQHLLCLWAPPAPSAAAFFVAAFAAAIDGGGGGAPVASHSFAVARGADGAPPPADAAPNGGGEHPPPPEPGPKRRWATTAALLREVGLPAEASAQYAAALEREALEPQTLAEVLAQQGQPALEAALKEALPGAPMGHRLRIISALSREVSP